MGRRVAYRCTMTVVQVRPASDEKRVTAQAVKVSWTMQRYSALPVCSGDSGESMATPGRHSWQAALNM